MERDYDTPEGKEAADDEAYMMPMEQRDPMMWDANMQICQDTLSGKPKETNTFGIQSQMWVDMSTFSENLHALSLLKRSKNVLKHIIH